MKVQRENTELKTQVRNLERTLKENNLVFSGLWENPWEQTSTTFDKVYRAISSVMMGSNKEKAKKIGIINATRIGKYNPECGRPICVSLLS